MRALTLTQPWASLVACGAKRIETRDWSTGYRGPLAIHAAKGYPDHAKALCFEEPFRGALAAAGLDGPWALPKGAIVAVATLKHCIHIPQMGPTTGIPYDDPLEMAFGDYSDGRDMWFLEDVRALPEPIPCRGALGLWIVPPEIVARLPQLAVA